MDTFAKTFTTSLQKANMLKCAILLFLFIFPALVTTAKADGEISGTKEDAPLKMNYSVSGGNIDLETLKGEIRPGETISASVTMADGFTDSNGIKDWNHLTLQISTKGETYVDKTFNCETFPSASGSYTVKDTDDEITVWLRTSSEYFLPYGSTTRGASIEVKYKVIKKENKNNSSSSSSSSYSSSYEFPKKEEAKCYFCGAPDSKIRINDMYGEVSTRCESTDNDMLESADWDTVIFEEDRIQTEEESGAILGLEDMSTFVIKPNSIIVIRSEEDKTTKLEMLRGRIWGNIQKMIEGKTWGFEMSQCVAGIKGTVFALEETGTESRAWLFTSKMDVTSKRTGETISLEPGQMARVGTDGIIRVEEFDIMEAAEDFDIPLTEIGGWYITHKPGFIVAAIVIGLLILAFPIIIIIVIVLAVKKKKNGCKTTGNNIGNIATPVPPIPVISPATAQVLPPVPPAPVASPAPPPPPVSSKVAPPPPPSSANTIICSQCGMENEADANFCTQCGHRF